MHTQNRRAAQSASRYEPLTTPQGWSGDEKRFVLRLTQLMDQLFEKQADLSKRLNALEKRTEQEDSNG